MSSRWAGFIPVQRGQRVTGNQLSTCCIVFKEHEIVIALSIFYSERTKAVVNLMYGRQVCMYPIVSVLWLLPTWRRKEPGRQQPWYWPGPRIYLRLINRKIDIEGYLEVGTEGYCSYKVLSILNSLTLPDPMLACHQWDVVPFTRGQCRRKYSIWSLTYVCRITHSRL